MLARRAAPLILALALAVAPGSAAALTAVPPRTVLTANRILDPSVGGLPDGRAVLTWSDEIGLGSTVALIRPAGAVFGASPQILGREVGDDPQVLPGLGTAPTLLTYEGNAGAVGFALTGDAFTARSDPLGVPSGTGRFMATARCPDGTVVVSRQNSATPPNTSVYGTVRSGDLTAGAPGSQTISQSAGTESFTQPAPNCDKATDPLVAWHADPDGNGAQLQHLYVVDLATGSGGFIFDRTVPAGKSAATPLTHVAPDGRLWIVWTEGGGGSSTTYVATRAPGVTTAIPTTAPTVLSTALYGATRLFGGRDGTTHVLLVGSALNTDVRTAAAGANSFGDATPLLGPGAGIVTSVLAHPDGAPRLLVRTEDSGVTRFATQGLPSAGSTEPRTDTGLSGTGFFSFSYLPSGDLLGTLATAGGPPVTLSEGGIDTGAPPTLANVSVPGLAAPGEPTALSIDALDPLGLGSFAWTVDGQTLGDQHTSFTFSKPGTYEVKARAVDRVGNAAEVSRTVRVLDPDGVAPGTTTTPPGTTPAPDTTKPPLKTTAKRGKKGKAKRTVTVSVTAGEVAAADIELIGTLKRGKQKGTLVLKSARLKALTAGKRKSLKLTVPTRLAKLVKNKLRVRVTLTDLAGNRTTKTVSVKRR